MNWLADFQGMGVLLSAAGGYGQARGDQNALNYEAQVGANNAAIARYQASLAKQVGASEKQRVQLNTAQIYGKQRASMGANNVVMGTGSATDILATTKYMGARDALTVQDNAARKAWAYQNEAQNAQSNSQFQSARAGSINPMLQGFSSFMGAAAPVASSWYKRYTQTGSFF